MQNVTNLPGLVHHRLTLPETDRLEVNGISLNDSRSVSGGEPVEFSRVLEGALDHVSGLQDVSADMQTSIELGYSDDLVGTMIAGQKASLAFQGVIQARNRVVSAYETVFNMPV